MSSCKIYYLYFQEYLNTLLKQLEKEERGLENQVKDCALRLEQESRVCFYSTLDISL